MDERAQHVKRRFMVAVASSAIAMASLFVARDAEAQIHWDASAQVGVMKRFLGGRAPGQSDAGFGPIGQLEGHIALLPLIKLGGYFGHDISPLPGDEGARDITFGGIQVKAMLPWVTGSWRAWVFVGFGYAGVYERSFHTTFHVLDGNGDVHDKAVRVEGAGGSFFDLPFGVGASYKLFKPWELCAELGARAGFGQTGSIYNPPGPQVTVADLPGQNAAPAGVDSWGLGLTVGILLDL